MDRINCYIVRLYYSYRHHTNILTHSNHQPLETSKISKFELERETLRPPPIRRNMRCIISTIINHENKFFQINYSKTTLHEAVAWMCVYVWARTVCIYWIIKANMSWFAGHVSVSSASVSKMIAFGYICVLASAEQRMK